MYWTYVQFVSAPFDFPFLRVLTGPSPGGTFNACPLRSFRGLLYLAPDRKGMAPWLPQSANMCPPSISKCWSI